MMIKYLIIFLLMMTNAYATNFELSTSGQNLGIGTASPNNTLGVGGNLAVGNSTYTQAIAPNNGAIIQGSVGIGSTSPQSSLTVAGGGIAGETVNKGYELIIPNPAGIASTTNEVNKFLYHKGAMYIAYYAATGGTVSAQIYKWDGNTVSHVYTFGTGSSFQSVPTLEEYQGNIYAGIQGTNAGDGDVYVSTDDGNTWTKSYDSATDQFAYCLKTFKGKLYAGMGYSASIINVFNGTSWSQAYSGMVGTSTGLVTQLNVYKGMLFASIGNGGLYGGIVSSPDGINFTTELSGITITRFAEFRGHLYATSENSSGSTPLYERNDSNGTWFQVATFSAATQCWGIASYNNALYVGCTESQGATVFKSYDGINFTTDFINNYAGGMGTEVFSMDVFDGSLYIGIGFSSSKTGDVWRKTDSLGQQTDWVNNIINKFRNNTYNGYNWSNDQSLMSESSPFSFDSNVGIATMFPTQALDVLGTVRATNLTVTSLNSGTQCLQVNSSGVVSGTGSVCGGSGSTPGGSSGNIQYNNSSSFGGATNLNYVGGNLGIGTAVSLNGILIIDGNVGINTSSPQTALEVGGFEPNGTSGLHFRVSRESGTYPYTTTDIWNDQYNSSYIDSNGLTLSLGWKVPTTYMESGLNNTTGTVSIGNSYWGSGTSAHFQHWSYLTTPAATDYVDWYLNPTSQNYELIRGDVNVKYLNVQIPSIFTVGNVGIGSINPTQKLDVIGTVKMTNFYMATSASSGYVLTSDISGNGTWQAGASGGSSQWTGTNPIYFNGNVGIGSVNPGETLDVNGTIRGIFPSVMNGTTTSTYLGTSTDQFNVAFGYQALQHWPPTYADENHKWYNTAIGIGALQAENSGGHYNVAVGYNALNSQNGGYDNVAIGLECLNYLTTGNDDTCVGGNAGAFHTSTGSYDVSVGGNFSANTTGSYNTVIGWGSLSQSNSDANQIFGNTLGTSITSGGYNIIMGYNSATALTTGAHNLIEGYLAGNNYTGGESYNILIGNKGVVGESDVTRIGDSSIQTDTYVAGNLWPSGNIGIGTSVAGKSLVIGGAGNKIRMEDANGVSWTCGPAITTGTFTCSSP